MALIKCTECGKEFSDKASACPNCGCPTEKMDLPKNEENKTDYGFFHKLLYGDNANAREAWNGGRNQSSIPVCPKCRGTDITFSIESVATKTNGKSEVRDKSVVSKLGNKAGRAAMIGMTGGLWALTPKRSGKKEIKKEKTKILNKKIAICQKCGYIWNVK